MIKESSIVDISVIIPTRNEEKFIENCNEDFQNKIDVLNKAFVNVAKFICLIFIYLPSI